MIPSGQLGSSVEPLHGARHVEDWERLRADPSIENADRYLLRHCNSTERPQCVLNMIPLLFPSGSEPEFWVWIARKWPLFDLIPHTKFRNVFRKFRHAWSPDCLPDAARSRYASLPAKMVVYRGQCASRPVTGLSWTTELEVARSFAVGHRGINNRWPSMFRATVLKKNVAMALEARSEAEIVLFSPPRKFAIT